MSALALIRQFHPVAMLMLCLLIVEFQIVLRSDLPIPERIFYLALVFGIQLGLLIFETYLNEHYQDADEDEGQVFWGIPKSYGGKLTTKKGE